LTCVADFGFGARWRFAAFEAAHIVPYCRQNLLLEIPVDLKANPVDDGLSRLLILWYLELCSDVPKDEATATGRGRSDTAQEVAMCDLQLGRVSKTPMQAQLGCESSCI